MEALLPAVTGPHLETAVRSVNTWEQSSHRNDKELVLLLFPSSVVGAPFPILRCSGVCWIIDPGAALMTVQREMIQLHTNVYTEPLLQVFCGKIPKDIYEDELIPHFEKCGKIWDLRLMMDPMTGLNRSESAVTMLSLLINIKCIQGLRFHHLHHQGRGSRGCQTGKVDFQFVEEPTGTNWN